MSRDYCTFKTRGHLADGHLAHCDVYRESDRVVKKIPLDARGVKGLRIEYEKTKRISRAWPVDLPQISVGPQLYSLTVPDPQLEIVDGHVLLSCRYAGVPSRREGTLAACVAVHQIGMTPQLPRLTYNSYLYGMPELYGGIIPATDHFLAYGLLTRREQNILVEKAKVVERSALSVVHGDLKDSHCLVRDGVMTLIDLDCAMLADAAIDYSVLSMQAIRRGQTKCDQAVEKMVAERGVCRTTFRFHRIVYTFIEISNTLLKERHGVSSVDLIPRQKDREFTAMLRGVRADCVSLGIQEGTVDRLMNFVHEYCARVVAHG